ncbi:39S ribosomal protein L44, mitochondrial [Bulinus truncatus]|nr:39S ribosomal protein L44, mitochondrial [Bulinus truncatus]
MSASIVRSCALARMTLMSMSFKKSSHLISIAPVRHYDQYRMKYLREMYKRRLEVGPEKERRRSEWINWNYDSEIFAFGKRLGEEFNEATLRQAFIHRSYVEKEKKKREELGLDIKGLTFDLNDNSELAEKGGELLSNYIKVYLRNMYPYFFEEGICAVHDYLVSESVLSHIAKHIGCGDLILSEDFPVLPSTLSHTFKAVVGALSKDQGQEQAERFVRDFVLPQLVSKDINELWEVVNPMGLLTAVLSLVGKGLPEPRLLWKSGSKTIMSVYWVGIYSDKRLLAKSPGETLPIAEEMAAREALKKLMKTEDSRSPLILGRMADNLALDYKKVNMRAADVLKNYYSEPKKQNSASS